MVLCYQFIDGHTKEDYFLNYTCGGLRQMKCSCLKILNNNKVVSRAVSRYMVYFFDVIVQNVPLITIIWRYLHYAAQDKLLYKYMIKKDRYHITFKFIQWDSSNSKFSHSTTI